ncbi:MAG: TolB protein [Actinomycetota bacterium]|nr:TolB protein [Actinomycetota bacterium]
MHDDLKRRLRDEVDAELGTRPPRNLSDALTRGRRKRLALRLVTTMSMVVVGSALVAGGLAIGRSMLSDEALPPANPRAEGIFAEVGGWIAYRSGSEIRAVDPANPTETRLIASSKEADPIGWSLDGGRLLLRPHPEPMVSYVDGGWQIGWEQPESPLDLFVLDSSGSRTRLTRGNGRSDTPSGTWGSFSPDGRNVVYACCGGAPGPYIIDADGGRPREVPGDRWASGGEPFAEWAAWSPDGSRIAFVDFWEGHPTYGQHAYTLSFHDPDSGDKLGEVVNVGAAGPTWAPDGSRLAFWAVVPDEDADPSNATLGPGGDFPAQIFVINADGSGLRQITHAGDNRWPTWSPDGSRIAFARGRLSFMTATDGSQAAYVQPGTRQLVTMAPDGTNVRIVEGVQPDGPIAWSPLP